MTTTANDAVSPDGYTNADLIANTTDTGNHTTVFNLGSLTDPSIALSFFVKKKDNDFVQIGMYNSSTNWNAVKFNIETGSVLDIGAGGVHSAPTNANITSYGNGWYRISAVFAATITSATEQVYITATPTSAPPSGAFGLGGGWTGATTENLWVYGAQAENSAAYPTSYINTNGTSVTRVADDADTTFATAFATSGSATWFLEFDGNTIPQVNQTGVNFVLNFASGDFLGYNHNATPEHRFRIFTSGSSYFAAASGLNANSPAKLAVSVTASSYTAYANGVEIGTASIVGNWASATSLTTTINDAFGSLGIKQMLFFPSALTATQMAELTA
jgi:hypothetical protein